MGDMNVSSQAMIKAAPQVAKAAARLTGSALEIAKEESDNIRKVALGGAIVGMVAGGPGGALAGALIGGAVGATILPAEFVTKQAIKGVKKLVDFIKKHPEAILAGPIVAPAAIGLGAAAGGAALAAGAAATAATAGAAAGAALAAKKAAD